MADGDDLDALSFRECVTQLLLMDLRILQHLPRDLVPPLELLLHLVHLLAQAPLQDPSFLWRLGRGLPPNKYSAAVPGTW